MDIFILFGSFGESIWYMFFSTYFALVLSRLYVKKSPLKQSILAFFPHSVATLRIHQTGLARYAQYVLPINNYQTKA